MTTRASARDPRVMPIPLALTTPPPQPASVTVTLTPGEIAAVAEHLEDGVTHGPAKAHWDSFVQKIEAAERLVEAQRQADQAFRRSLTPCELALVAAHRRGEIQWP